MSSLFSPALIPREQQCRFFRQVSWGKDLKLPKALAQLSPLPQAPCAVERLVQATSTLQGRAKDLL